MIQMRIANLTWETEFVVQCYVDALKDSLKHIGQINACLVDKASGEAITGAHRLTAMQQMGTPFAWCKQVDAAKGWAFRLMQSEQRAVSRLENCYCVFRALQYFSQKKVADAISRNVNTVKKMEYEWIAYAENRTRLQSAVHSGQTVNGSDGRDPLDRSD